jgi:hypothetical protein
VIRREVLVDIIGGRRQVRHGRFDYCLSTGEEVSSLSDDQFFILPHGPHIRRTR